MNTSAEEKTELLFLGGSVPASIIIDSNSSLLTRAPEAGSIENDGSGLFYTNDSNVRQSVISGTVDGNIPASGTPAEWMKVIVNGKEYLMPLYSAVLK